MARSPERSSDDSRPVGQPRRSTWRERAFVLGGLALALPATAVSLALGAGGGVVGFVWLVAVAWTVAASLACALRRGLVDRDWTAFRGTGRRHDRLPDTRAESFDWDTRTGAFAWMRIREDRERLLDDDRSHHGGI